jgi:hypothetical protein
MKTVKVIHYPQDGNRTTEIFEAEKVKVVEGYMHELLTENNIAVLHEENRTFGSRMNLEKPNMYWIIILYLDDEIMLAGLNSKVYIMVDGKTVASYESIMID